MVRTLNRKDRKDQEDRNLTPVSHQSLNYSIAMTALDVGETHDGCAVGGDPCCAPGWDGPTQPGPGSGGKDSLWHLSAKT